MQDTAILGYLGRALSLELSAVQQYLAMAKVLDMRGMMQAGEKFRHEASEELSHAERIIGRMVAMGLAPSASRLRPVQVEGSLPQLIEHAVRLENEIVTFYTQAVAYCTHAQDIENRVFFSDLLREEQEHASSIDQFQKLILDGHALDELKREEPL